MKKSVFLGASLALLGAAGGGTAQAQDAAAKPAAPAAENEAQIIVTATKRAETLQDTPVAVSVVSTKQIEQAAIVDLKDLQTLVPSLRVHTLQNSSQTTFTIRGFGNGANNPGIESSVGVFIDGVYRSRSAAAILDLPVLDHVEVLRGPQSTLFGKNVSAGAISITTLKPEFEIGGVADATFGNFNERRFSGTATGPISDKLAVRLSGSLNKRDGYYTNTVTGTKVADHDRWSLRADFLYEASDDLSFRFIADANKIDEVCCGVVQLFNGSSTNFIGAPVPFGLGKAIDHAGDDDYRMTSDVDPYNRLDGDGLSLQADWNLHWAQFTSITAHRNQTDASDTDVDFTGAKLATNPQDRKFDTFTQEFRLASTGSGPFSWLVGAFYFDESVDSSRDIIFGSDMRNYVNGLTKLLAGDAAALAKIEAGLGLPTNTFFAAGTGYIGRYHMDDTSYSLFAQGDYDITSKLRATLGLGYTRDEKTYTLTDKLTDSFSALTTANFQQIGFAQAFQAITGQPATPANLGNPAFAGAVTAASNISVTPCSAAHPPPACNSAFALTALQFFHPPVNVPNANEDGTLDGDKTNITARLSYAVSDDLNVYATYATGWKAGAVNLSSDSRVPDANGVGRTAKPEDVETFEIGLKKQWNTGFVNVALFDQSIKGFQSNLFVGTAFNLANAGEQSSKGFELESQWRPFDPLLLTFGATYVDAKYDSFKGAPCVSFDTKRCGAGQVSRDLSGDKVAGVPEWTLDTSVAYTHRFTDDLKGFVRAEYSYQSDTDVIENVPAQYASREVRNLNASTGLDLSTGTELMLWVRNATDHRELQSAFPTVVQTGSYSGYLSEPRTYGVTLRQRW